MADTSRRHAFSFSVRTLLLIVVPLCAGLAYYGRWQQQRRAAIAAYDLMSSKGPTANIANGSAHATYTFKKGSVTDSDLLHFIPAFNGYAPSGFARIETIRLGGSKVSADAVKRFHQAVPNCSLEPGN